MFFLTGLIIYLFRRWRERSVNYKIKGNTW